MAKIEKTLLMLTFVSFIVFFLSMIGTIVLVVRISIYHDKFNFTPFVVLLTSFMFLVIFNSILNFGKKMHENNKEITLLTKRIENLENMNTRNKNTDP